MLLFAFMAGTPLCAAAGMGILVFLLRRRWALLDSRIPVTAESICDLSVEQYAPMLDLLNTTDIESLRSQPGYTPKLERQLRAQRCREFRAYLKSFDTDFLRICAAIKLLMVHSRVDRPDLATFLLRSQMLFAITMLRIQVKLFVFQFGLCRIDLSENLALFHHMRSILGALIPPIPDELAWAKPCRDHVL